MRLLSVLAVFIAAFLVFQIQPILGKEMLPQFGGSASVWITSMMFFQTILFAAYCYALLLGRLPTPAIQMRVHLVSMVLALLSLSGLNSDAISHSAAQYPVTEMVTLLWQKAGLPYVVLASSGVLLQRWLIHLQPSGRWFEKYWFAWSNSGALLALCSYPFVIEPFVSLDTQLSLWGLGFIFFFLILACGIVWALCQPAVKKDRVHSGAVSFSVYWILYPLAGVMVLLATTHMLTQNVPPVPLLWLAPLVLYLLTYILCFSGLNCYDREYFLPLLLFCVVASSLMFLAGSHFAIKWQVSMYLFILFISCFVCHGELRLLAPASGTDHSLYYWSISLGGCLGGCCVALLAPMAFEQLLEYPIAILSVLVMLIWQLRQTRQLSPGKTGLWCVLMVSLVSGFLFMNKLMVKDQVIAYRNFYGVVSVRDIEFQHGTERRLVDGTTVHGTQLLTEAIESVGETPVSRAHYYRENAGIDVAFNFVQQQDSVSIGVVGLGAGVLASYGRLGDHFTFYEINPAVISLAHSHFSYLRHSPADIKVIQGDARMRLKEKTVSGDKYFDLLVIDAFSSDAIPVHLLTQEAFALYREHLKPEGVLAVHISSTYLDLNRVIKQHVSRMSMSATLYSMPGSAGNFGSDWMVIAVPEVMARLKQPLYSKDELSRKLTNANPVIWTDQHHSILALLKTGQDTG